VWFINFLYFNRIQIQFLFQNFVYLLFPVKKIPSINKTCYNDKYATSRLARLTIVVNNEKIICMIVNIDRRIFAVVEVARVQRSYNWGWLRLLDGDIGRCCIVYWVLTTVGGRRITRTSSRANFMRPCRSSRRRTAAEDAQTWVGAGQMANCPACTKHGAGAHHADRKQAWVAKTFLKVCALDQSVTLSDTERVCEMLNSTYPSSHPTRPRRNLAQHELLNELHQHLASTCFGNGRTASAQARQNSR
jgi:hypothetical protein